MNLEETKNFIKNVEGWLTDKESTTLFNLAKKCTGKGVIIEIGSWNGKSTICLGQGSQEGNKTKIYAVDPHIGSSEHQKENKKINTFEKFKKNIKNAQIDYLVNPIVKTSKDAAKKFDKPIELIFIDGAHEYDLVKLDFDAWYPKVLNGGIMAFHDTVGWDGPKKVVKDLLYRSKYFKNVNFIDSITFGQKVKKNSFKDRLRNRYILLLKDSYELMGKLLPPSIKKVGKKIMNSAH